MIIDFQKDTDHSRRYTVYDAVTGERLSGPTKSVVWADDETGIYRYIPRDEVNGQLVLRMANSDQRWTPVIEEARRANGIRIGLRTEGLD